MEKSLSYTNCEIVNFDTYIIHMYLQYKQKIDLLVQKPEKWKIDKTKKADNQICFDYFVWQQDNNYERYHAAHSWAQPKNVRVWPQK